LSMGEPLRRNDIDLAIGRCSVYEKTTGSSSWTRVFFLDGDNSFACNMGLSCALARDARTVIVGATFYNNSQGFVEIYEDDSTEAWQSKGLRILGPESSDFGWSAAITSNGTIIAVGVLRTGSVHFYEFKENNWQQRTFGGFITGNQFSFGYGRQFVFLL
jgi:hypothetical protein